MFLLDIKFEVDHPWSRRGHSELGQLANKLDSGGKTIRSWLYGDNGPRKRYWRTYLVNKPADELATFSN